MTIPRELALLLVGPVVVVQPMRQQQALVPQAAEVPRLRVETLSVMVPSSPPRPVVVEVVLAVQE
jgi:hypothetical protein